MHENCIACVRRIGNTCLAFVSPRRMWQSGYCWGYTDDVARVERELQDCVEYARQQGHRSTVMEAELRRYAAYWAREERRSA